MRDAGTVATLLPLTAFALKEPYARGREMIDSGCAVALATDLNPGSCFSGSIPLTFALACIYMRLTIEEAITALTLNGAAALNRADSIGSIEVGKKGDFVVLNSDNYHFLPIPNGKFPKMPNQVRRNGQRRAIHGRHVFGLTICT